MEYCNMITVVYIPFFFLLGIYSNNFEYYDEDNILS